MATSNLSDVNLMTPPESATAGSGRKGAPAGSDAGQRCGKHGRLQALAQLLIGPADAIGEVERIDAGVGRGEVEGNGEQAAAVELKLKIKVAALHGEIGRAHV